VGCARGHGEVCRLGRRRSGMRGSKGILWIVGSRASRQMIIHVPFVQSVRLKAILLKLGE
jgi:hypothetical protein